MVRGSVGDTGVISKTPLSREKLNRHSPPHARAAPSAPSYWHSRSLVYVTHMAAGILSPGLSRLLAPPQYLIPSLFYRVQLPFSQSGVLIELSSGYLKVVARLGLVFMWNDDDSLLVRMGDGCGWAEPSSKMGVMGGVS